MSSKYLHIVTFDNPYPPNYGGVIDVFYKVKTLSKLGVKIYLHCFIKDREDFSGIEPYCEQVFSYAKLKNPFLVFNKHPVSVAFRMNKNLLRNLQKTKAPILFEGLQTTGVLAVHDFSDRKILIRAHNSEPDYYKGLAKSESNFIKKIAFNREAKKYEAYESILTKADRVFAISVFENAYFNGLKGVHSLYIPPFHGNTNVKELSPFGKYAFYHGDLTISDNLKAAFFLINVFKKLDYALVIAGDKNLDLLKKKVAGYAHIVIQKIGTKKVLKELFNDAHINICMSLQRSGTKLKGINALYNGRHCVINENIIDDREVLECCHVFKKEEDLKQLINELKKTPFVAANRRQVILDKVLNVEKNAQQILELL